MLPALQSPNWVWLHFRSIKSTAVFGADWRREKGTGSEIDCNTALDRKECQEETSGRLSGQMWKHEGEQCSKKTLNSSPLR